MTLSMAARARRMEVWSRTAGVCSSVLVHAGLAAYLLHSAPPTLSRETADPQNLGGAIALSLQRSPSSGPASAVSALGSVRAPTASRDAFTPMMSKASSATPPDATKDGRSAGAGGGSTAEAGAAPPLSGRAEAPDIALGADYQRELQDHIRPFQSYPADAEQAAVRGVVELSFEIDRQGRLLDVRVSKTSGSASLDAAAVSAVRRAAPMPPIPPALPDALSVDLPVEFFGAG